MKSRDSCSFSGAVSPKICSVVGTRPELIKLIPLIEGLRRDSSFTQITVSTGQHREMLFQIMDEFGVKADYDLSIMTSAQSLNGIVASSVRGLDRIFERECPDLVVVQGDTSTALAAALAAFNLKIPVVHLEAGLRAGREGAPFPEEGNRRVIAQLSSLHLAPTSGARVNLLGEGVVERDILVTGNTVIDALFSIKEKGTTFSDEGLATIASSDKPIIMVTTHRRENLDAMANIGEALAEIARRAPEYRIVFPAHLNPRVRDVIFPIIKDVHNIYISDPLGYPEFVKLMNRSSLILSDSGGVQEEAPSLGIPVLVMRESTERPEAVEAGTVRLVGTNKQSIIDATMRLIENPEEVKAMANAVNPYGDGKAAERSIAAMKRFLGIEGYDGDIEEFAP